MAKRTDCLAFRVFLQCVLDHLCHSPIDDLYVHSRYLLFLQLVIDRFSKSLLTWIRNVSPGSYGSISRDQCCALLHGDGLRWRKLLACEYRDVSRLIWSWRNEKRIKGKKLTIIGPWLMGKKALCYDIPKTFANASDHDQQQPVHPLKSTLPWCDP